MTVGVQSWREAYVLTSRRMSTHGELVAELVATVSDYRQGEIAPIDAPHVERWLAMFDTNVRDPILSETVHVLKKTYVSRANAKRFLATLATSAELVGADPPAFWRTTSVANIQRGGASQRELLVLFDEVLKQQLGVSLDQCPPAAERVVYIDDGVFSGQRTRADLVAWVNESAPATCHLHVVAIALHRGGMWFAEEKIKEAASGAKKNITVQWWRSIELENRRSERNSSDVLWPSQIPTETRVQGYAEQLTQAGYPPTAALRAGNEVGSLALFSSPAARDLLEQEFLKAGAKARELCPNLPATCRPLGFTKLHTFGFGSTIVTYRNCPNTTPLALWVDDPWVPLFPRKTNADTGRVPLF